MQVVMDTVLSKQSVKVINLKRNCASILSASGVRNWGLTPIHSWPLADNAQVIPLLDVARVLGVTS